MTQMTADLWNVLHDGSVREITGFIPGDVRLGVDIGYLRRRFSDPGGLIFIALHGCTAFDYQADFEDAPLTEFRAIAAAAPEILHAENRTDASEVYCVAGTLRICAEAFSVALDSGQDISFEDLCSVSEAYWREWSQPSADV